MNRKDFIFIIIVNITLCTIAYSFGRISFSNIKKPQTNPCKCLTLKETLLYVEKTEMFVDKMQYAKKGQRNQLIDSVNKYRTLLKSEGNEIEY